MEYQKKTYIIEVFVGPQNSPSKGWVEVYKRSSLNNAKMAIEKLKKIWRVRYREESK